MWPPPGHPTAPLLALATQSSHLPLPGAQSCFAMGSWPGALVMGTWRNSNPHPSILPAGYKAQSQREHHLLLQAGPAWSQCDTPPVTAPHFAASPPALGSLIWIWSPNATKTTITYSATNSAPKPCTGSSADPVLGARPPRTARPPQTTFGARTRSNNEFPHPT